MLIFLLIILLTIATYLTISSRKKEKLEAIEKMIFSGEIKEKKGIYDKLNVPTLQKNEKWVAVVVFMSTILGALFVWLIGGSIITGGIIGFILPWAIVVQLTKVYQKKYREDGKQCIEFLGAITAANGSLEDWLVEVVPRLHGPLKPVFIRGATNYREGIPITKFLENLVKNCPDSYLQHVFAGLLHQHREAGDIKAFVNEVLGDMSNQERLMRVMTQERKNGQQMIFYLIGFPTFFYLLFKESVHQTMRLHPHTIFVFILGAIGLGIAVYVGNRITRSNMFD